MTGSKAASLLPPFVLGCVRDIEKKAWIREKVNREDYEERGVHRPEAIKPLGLTWAHAMAPVWQTFEMERLFFRAVFEKHDPEAGVVVDDFI